MPDTPNLGLHKPAIGDTGWGDSWNENADIIDAKCAPIIQTATVTLTDAQIKSLPTAGITLVHLTGSQQPVLLSLFYQLDTAGGAYTDVDGGARFFLQNEDGITLADDSSGSNFPLTTAAESRGGLFPFAWGDVSNPATQQIQLWLNNNTGGQQPNLTGGNAANTLIATVVYIKLTRQ